MFQDQYRTEHSSPILDELHQTLQDMYCKSLPNAPHGKAIAYTLKEAVRLYKGWYSANRQ